MAFTLSAQRDEDVIRGFERYAAYVESVRDRLPSAVYDLASSDWYFRRLTIGVRMMPGWRV